MKNENQKTRKVENKIWKLGIKFSILFFIIGYTISLIAPLLAQDNSTDDLSTKDQTVVIDDVEGLRADFKEEVQNPETKVKRYIMILKSNIDSDRVKITWTRKGPNFFTNKNQATVDMKVAKGQEYSIPIDLTFTGTGLTELLGRAEAFKADSTFVVTIRKNIITNLTGEVAEKVAKSGTSYVFTLPQSYEQAKVFVVIKNVLLIVLGFGLLAVLALLGYRAFYKWLNKTPVN